MQPTTSIKQKIPFIFLVVGLIIIGIGVLAYLNGKTPSSYAKTTGTIVSVKSENVVVSSKSNQYALNYYPIITFNVGGVDYQFQGAGTGYNPMPSPVGQKVSVAYNPSSPGSSPSLPGDNGPVIFSSVIGVLGALVCIISAILYVKNRKTI